MSKKIWNRTSKKLKRLERRRKRYEGRDEANEVRKRRIKRPN